MITVLEDELDIDHNDTMLKRMFEYCPLEEVFVVAKTNDVWEGLTERFITKGILYKMPWKEAKRDYPITSTTYNHQQYHFFGFTKKGKVLRNFYLL